MVSKTVLAVVCAIATGVLFTVGYLRHTHDRAEALLRAWEADGPHTTAVGRVRVMLAALTWLGPLRPDAPRDPLKECRMPPTSDAWWTTWRRLACLEDHMAEARADHSRFVANLLSVLLIAVSFLVIVVFLLAKMPQYLRGASLPRGLVLRNARLLAKQRQERSHSSGNISRIRRLKDAAKAALSRRRRKKAGEKVSHDSLDWWREADNGRDKLVVQPQEHIWEKFRPYPYPKPPSPMRRVYDDLPIPHLGGPCPCAASSRWMLFLNAAILLLQVFLCFRGGAARRGHNHTPHTT